MSDAFEFFSNVISAILAFAFDHVSGRCGLSGWQWQVPRKTFLESALALLTRTSPSLFL